jgi:conjugative relaxase-like TrwC/TraI family protein
MQAFLLAITIMVASYQAFKASFDGSYFLSLASAEYYTDGGEPPGQWFGSGAKVLGLSGSIEERDFRRLLAGYHPRKPRQLVKSRPGKPDKPDQGPPDESPSDRRADPRNNPNSPTKPSKKLKQPAKRCPAYDVTFSVPKSVSVCWAVGDEHVRRQIDAAIDVAVKRVISWLEHEVLLGRRGKSGRYRQHAKLVTGMFDHTVSRSENWQPQRHRHVVIVNACQLASGVWSAVDSYELRKWVRLLGPMFRVEVAAQLKQRLGFEIERAERQTGGDDAGFHIKGISKSLCTHWSSRRSEILELLDGGKIRLNKGTAKARQVATLLSRKSKERLPPRKQLLTQWEQEAAKFGVNPQTIQQLLRRSTATEFDAAYRSAWQASISKLTRGEAYFSDRQFLQTIAEAVQHEGVDSRHLAQKVKRDLKRSPDIVRLGKVGREKRFTTKEMWELEERLLRSVELLQSRSGAVVKDSVTTRVLKKHRQLDTEQTAAAIHLMTQKSAIRILTGVAGSGKSRTLDAVRMGFERSGFVVLGGSLSGQATEELASKAHVPSRTVASYLYHLDATAKQKLKDRIRHDVRQLLRAALGKSTWKHAPIKFDKNTVLILDEVGMIDTRSLERLIHHATKAGATVICVGDDKQLAPVMAGGPLHHLKGKVGHAQLTKNYRQKDQADQAAGQALREGDATAALKNYVERGRLTIGKDRRDTITKLVAAWALDGGARRPKDSFVFTETREEAHVVNRLCQQERLRRKLVPQVASVRSANERFYRGDRVMFHVQDRKLGIKNGYRGTVVAVNPILGRLKVRLDRKPTKEPGRRRHSQTVTVSIKTLERAGREQGRPGMTLGYAGTTHKLQGGSTKTAYMLVGGPLTAREMAYTQATRGAQKTLVFVDRLHAGDELKDLAKMMSQSRAKNLAHDIVKDQNHRPAPALRHEIVHQL